MTFRAAYLQHFPPDLSEGGSKQDYAEWWVGLNQGEDCDKLNDGGVEALFEKLEFSPDSFEAIVFLCLLSGESLQVIEKDSFISLCENFQCEATDDLKVLVSTVQGQLLTIADIYQAFCRCVGQYIAVEGQVHFNPEVAMTVAYFTLIFVAGGKFKLAKKWLLFVHQKMVEGAPPILDLKEWNTLAELLWQSNETEWTSEQVQKWYEENQEFEGGPLDSFVDGFDNVPEDFTASEEEVKGFTTAELDILRMFG